VNTARWIAAREPSPAAALAGRLRQVVRAAPEDAPAADALVDAAIEHLCALGDGCRSRSNALDLLTVDALVTYAFEAACDEPDRLAARAADAMQRISRVVARTPDAGA
jgi:hypothetical protein